MTVRPLLVHPLRDPQTSDAEIAPVIVGYQPRNLTSSFPTMLSKSHPTSTRSAYRSLRAASSLNRRQALPVHVATRIPLTSSVVSSQSVIPGRHFSGVPRHFATASEQQLFRIVWS